MAGRRTEATGGTGTTGGTETGTPQDRGARQVVGKRRGVSLLAKLEKLEDARINVTVARIVADGWFYPRFFRLAERYLYWRIDRVKQQLEKTND
jgi:hypothetical protein